MKRMLMITLLIALVLAPIIKWWSQIVAISKDGKDVVPFIFNLLQLGGIILIVVLVAASIVQYTLSFRPHRFIFEGLSNASKLDDLEKRPLDLNALAREELMHQLKLMYLDWKKAVDHEDLDVDMLLAENQNLQADRQKRDTEKRYIMSADKTITGNLTAEFKMLISSSNQERGHLMNMDKELALPQADLIMKLINAFIAPNAIKAIGHLQWKDETSDSDRIGITLELQDLSDQHTLQLRTIWWPPSGYHAKLTQENGVSVYYGDLLTSAMHWLALMFFEYQLTWHKPFANRIPIFNLLPFLKNRESRRKAKIHLVLALLYFASSKKYQAYKNFFLQLATEQVHQAMEIEPDWYLPFLYRANIYSFRIQEEIHDPNIDNYKSGKIMKNVFGEVDNLYDEVLTKAGEDEIYSKYRVIIQKSLSRLAFAIILNDDKYVKDTAENLKQLEDKHDPACWDPEKPECSTCLYNLALFYITAYLRNQKLGIAPTSWKKGRRYLACCLSRFSNLRDIIYEDLQQEGLETLKDELDKKKEKIAKLEKSSVDRFKTEIDEVLDEVYPDLKAVYDENTANNREQAA